MAYCMQCGHELPENAAYCPRCDRPTPKTLASSSSPKTGGSKALWLLVAAGCAVFAFFFLGIIAAILIPNFLDALHRAKQKRTMADLTTSGGAILSYWVEHEALPPGETYEEVIRVVEDESSQTLPRIDGWKRPFRYECWSELEEPGAESASCDVFRLASAGRDGVFEHESLADYERGAFPHNHYDRDVVFDPGGPFQFPGARDPAASDPAASDPATPEAATSDPATLE